MATNKNAQLRYLVLDRCFRDKRNKYGVMDLLEACNQALYEHYGRSVTIARRQVYKDIDFMESEAGWAIPLEKTKVGRNVYYRYAEQDFSINRCELKDSELQALKETTMMLGRLKGLPQYEWMEGVIANLEDKLNFKGSGKSAIGYEANNYYSGNKYIGVLFEAILNKQVLRVSYGTFGDEGYVWSIHPYYIMQYNNRWFLLGGNNEHLEQIVTIPLDRINEIEPIDVNYVDTEIDFDDYFDDVIGVTVPKGKVAERVRLRLSPKDYCYIVTKPPHGSMRVNDKEFIITLEVIPNYELEALILSYGEGVEVLEPLWLRERMRERVEKLLKHYQ